MSRRFHTRLAAGVGALALALSACTSSTGGAQPDEGDGNAGQADTPEMTIAMITHAVPGDTFWDFIRDGAKAAAAKDNVDLEYSSSPQGPEQATLIKNAIDQGVDGIAVTLAKPDAMRNAVQEALDAGIPVVALNSGLNDWKQIGAQMYFGQDEQIAGQTAGERLSQDGAKHVLCVIQEQGHVALEARCDGVEQAFSGQTETLYVNGQDMTQVDSTIENKLRTTPSIDRVVTLGAPFAMTALGSIQQANSDAGVVTFDLNGEAIKAIQDGRIDWAINQQPWVQGYAAVDALWMKVQKARDLGGGQPVLTGPSFVDAENVDAVAGQF